MFIQDLRKSLDANATALYEQKKREKELKSHPETMEMICSHVADGGSLATLCEKKWYVNYGRMAQWINADDGRREMLTRATEARLAWERDRILAELRVLGLFDIRDLLDEAHCVKPPDQWPDHISRAIESMEVKELFEQGPDGGRIKIGEVKKINLVSKLKALELLGKTSALYVERHELAVKPMSLGMMVEQSFNEQAIDVTDSTARVPSAE